MDLERLNGWETWSVLGVSLAVDGAVLSKSVSTLLRTKPKDKALVAHLKEVRDPTLLAVLCEDAAACAGVVVVALGMRASVLTGVAAYDACSGVAIGGVEEKFWAFPDVVRPTKGDVRWKFE